MRVSSLHVYPIKSSRVVDVDAADVELGGLRHDRRWVVVDATGHRLDARSHAVLMTITARPDDAGALTLSAPGRREVLVPEPIDGPHVEVDVKRLSSMVDAGGAAAAWLTDVLGEPVRLAWQDDLARRTVSPRHGGTGDDPLNISDAGPLLIATTASLRQLDTWIAEEHGGETMAMGRFRPNVVVDGDVEPFVEDTWRRVTIGDVPFRFAEHCDRCVMTTMDPDTTERGKEPIRTLARHRRWDGKTWFGIRVIPLRTGRIAVGEAVAAD